MEKITVIRIIKVQLMISIVLLIMSFGTAKAAPSVDLGTASGNPCAQVIIPITLTNDGITQIAGVATDIGYNSTFLTPISAAIGPAGSAAGKDVYTNIVSAGLFRVLILSTNLNTIGNGVVANVTFEINCDAPANSYTLSNDPSCGTPEGADVPCTGSNGTITSPECNIKSIQPSGIRIGLDLIPRIRRVTLTLNNDLEALGITCADLNIQNAPRGVRIISCAVTGDTIEATILFWGVQPGTYNINLGPCGSIPFVVARF